MAGSNFSMKINEWTNHRLARTITDGTNTILSATAWLYDGWNPIAEYTRSVGVSPTLSKTYLWGLDLSGTLQGAGGVGGLLSSSSLITNNPITYNSFHPSYDGNGNITAWTQSGTTTPVNRREYDAFGNVVVEQGAAPCAFGFSTKLEDPETGLLYYGQRYYSPPLGRWVSEDPIKEEGGLNLNGFLENDGIGSIDVLGSMTFSPKWVGKPGVGPTYDGEHLWIAAWLDTNGASESDSGYVVERFEVKVVKLTDCSGTPISTLFEGSKNDWTLSPFGPKYRDPFRGSVGPLPIYTVFVNTTVGYDGGGGISDCQKGEVIINWAFRYYQSDNPLEIAGSFNKPITVEVNSDSSGKANEKQHKYWTNVSPLSEGQTKGLKQSGSFSMRVWWDWCGSSPKKTVMHSPDWPIADRPGR